MASERQEQVRIERSEGFERGRKVVEYSPSLQMVLLSRVSKLIWLAASVVSILLAFRFMLKLIAANPGNSFTDFIYRLTDILVTPFVGIVSTPASANGSIVDVGSLFAIAIYAIAAVVIIQLLRILFASAGSSRRVTTIEERRD